MKNRRMKVMASAQLRGLSSHASDRRMSRRSAARICQPPRLPPRTQRPRSTPWSESWCALVAYVDSDRWTAVEWSLFSSVCLSWNIAEVNADPLSVADVAADFSSTSNPTGVWSYGWSMTLGSPFILSRSPAVREGLDTWRGNVVPDGREDASRRIVQAFPFPPTSK